MTEPVLSQIDTGVCATAQLEPAAMAWAAQQGFRAVVNNRPDGEGGPDQPTSAEIAAAAQAVGLAYAHLPVHPQIHSAEEVAKMAELMDSLPKPVLLFCRSGGRSTRLYQSAKASA